jgi:hypothetical protein
VDHQVYNDSSSRLLSVFPFPSSFGAATTSTKTVQEIEAELKKALRAEKVNFSIKSQDGCTIRCSLLPGQMSGNQRRSMRAGKAGAGVVWEMAIANLEKLGKEAGRGWPFACHVSQWFVMSVPADLHFSPTLLISRQVCEGSD